MRQHLVGYVRPGPGDDGYHRPRRKRAARNAHREVGPGKRQRAAVRTDECRNALLEARVCWPPSHRASLCAGRKRCERGLNSQRRLKKLGVGKSWTGRAAVISARETCQRARGQDETAKD